MKIIRPWLFYKAYKHFHKLIPVVVVIALVYFIFFQKFEKPEIPMGTYYAYHITPQGDSVKALILRGYEDCELIPDYSNYAYSKAKPKDNQFYMDTTLISIKEPVELVGTDCDSTVGIIKYKNKYFRNGEREGKRNSRSKKGLISLKDIHIEKPL